MPPPAPGRRARRRWAVCVALALAVAALTTSAYRLGWLATAQGRSTDFLFSSRGPERPRATVLVGIDERSHQVLMARHGAMVDWPRTLYAQAIDALAQAGARVVVLDLFFDAPRPGDTELALAMRRAGNVVVPAEAQGPGPLAPAPGVAQEFVRFAHLPRPLVDASAGEGFTNVATDRDSVVRGVPLLLRGGGEELPALALAAVARFVRRPSVMDAPPERATVYGAGRAIPLVDGGRGGRMLINFLGPPPGGTSGASLPIVSFVDVVDGTLDPAGVRDRIVVLGLTVRGLDQFATPITAEARMWGVELLGHTIETILQDRYLTRASAVATIGTMLALAVLTALVVAAIRPVLAGLGVLALLVAYLVGCIVAFDHGLVLNLVYPPLTAAVTAGVTLLYRVRSGEAEQRLLREVMARYLSPTVSQWVLRDPARLALGGETRSMTALFCDLRGFTTLAHELEPEALVELLNEHMSAMTEIVFRHDGVLDKYIGDALMAFWGAPMAQPDHAARACRTALDMVHRLGELQADWARRGRPRLEVGIGINTGSMVVGNMGSRSRLAYTVVGDAVNVAARLEGLSKEYGVRVVVGEGTRKAAGAAFEYRFLDVVAVKGRSEPLAVHEVLAEAGALLPGRRAWLARYDEGIGQYRARRFEEARTVFAALLGEAPADGPAGLYLRRSEALLASPPPADWDGVYVARTK
jgi:adenylate cyclase